MNRTNSIAFPRLAAQAPRVAVPFLALALALGGCQMSRGGEEATLDAAPQTVAAGPGERVIERDVEAPEVFRQEEPGLWDGRPSLGGVWVAHPAAQDPERVLIRNPATGQTVIGALFRRERENPGPRFQVSSEAAGALGILAGAPTPIEVTALRLQRVEMEIAPAEEPSTAAEETLAIAPVAGTAATAATTAAAAAPGVPAGQVEITPEAEPARERRGLFGLFRRDREAEPAAESIAETALDAPDAAPDAAPATAPATEAMAEAEAPRERRGLFGLFRRNREPEPDTTLIALPDAGDAPTSAAAAAPLQAAGTAPLPPQAAPQTTPPAPRIDRPFVQIGIFSVEQNAINARAQMQREGLSAEIRRGQVGENNFWRVVVGPAGTTEERARFLARVRALGFADAYAVVR